MTSEVHIAHYLWSLHTYWTPSEANGEFCYQVACSDSEECKDTGALSIQIHIKEYHKEIHQNLRGCFLSKLVYSTGKENVFFKLDITKDFNKAKVNYHIYVLISSKKKKKDRYTETFI